MIKTETLKVKVIEEQQTRETCTCDVCSNLIYERSLIDSEELPENNFQIGYWEVHTGHYDWGANSSDSYEHYYVCSEECLTKLFDEYKDRSKHKTNITSNVLYIPLSNANTQFIRIEHNQVWCYKGGI